MWFDESGDTHRVDINGRMVKRIEKDKRDLIVYDENNRVTRYDCDEWNNPVKTTQAAGAVVAKAYDPANQRMVQKSDEL